MADLSHGPYSTLKMAVNFLSLLTQRGRIYFSAALHWSWDCGDCFEYSESDAVPVLSLSASSLSLLEPSLHVVREPKQPFARVRVEENRGPWLPAQAELSADS